MIGSRALRWFNYVGTDVFLFIKQILQSFDRYRINKHEYSIDVEASTDRHICILQKPILFILKVGTDRDFCQCILLSTWRECLLTFSKCLQFGLIYMFQVFTKFKGCKQYCDVHSYEIQVKKKILVVLAFLEIIYAFLNALRRNDYKFYIQNCCIFLINIHWLEKWDANSAKIVQLINILGYM